MKRQPRLVTAKPERHVGAEDVHAMSTRSERLPQFGRDNTAAANRGVADDADVHQGHRSSPGRTTGSRTMNPSAHRTPASAPNWASRLSIICRKSGVLSRVAATPGTDGGVNWLA